ncbi:CLUMA_CG007121, isoform A [Clunio marinus]|uniref:CLUMA_CG007121, isoform A n=1 Tax=Clunio marinus TaxID=568069 RepID=A0A1J1I1X1_9DIPT|nr:CLUMA_CG007121, isoform A [Clunio marinus]
MKAFHSFTLEYRYSVMYREVFRSPKVEWCSMESYSNPAFKLLFEVLRFASSNMYVGCPVKLVDFKNAIVPVRVMPEIFPRGDYRMKLFYYDGLMNDRWYMNVTLISTVRSSEHSRYG